MSWINWCSRMQKSNLSYFKGKQNKRKSEKKNKSLTHSSWGNSGANTVTTFAKILHCCQGNQMTSAHNPQASVPHCVISCHSPAAHIHIEQSFYLKCKSEQTTVYLSHSFIFKEQVCTIKVHLDTTFSTWGHLNKSGKLF